VVPGGHSSAGRAPALQAGGHRFEPGCLHYLPVRQRRTRSRSEREANNPPDGRCKVRCDYPADAGLRLIRLDIGSLGDGRWSKANCIARKGHEIVALVFSLREHLRSRRSLSLSGAFVLCQGESGSGASLGACDGSGIVCCVRPVVRLMSDRESVSGVLNHGYGSTGWPHAPKSDSEGSEALCVLIRIVCHPPQGVAENPGSVPKMIDD
jgi:hypothetical protein